MTLTSIGWLLKWHALHRILQPSMSSTQSRTCVPGLNKLKDVESERVSRGNPAFVSKLSKLCKIALPHGLTRSVRQPLFLALLRNGNSVPDGRSPGAALRPFFALEFLEEVEG